jgi:hypothetical protein
VLRVFMTNLRKKLEVNPSRPTRIITEAGVGYRLVVDGPGNPPPVQYVTPSESALLS